MGLVKFTKEVIDEDNWGLSCLLFYEFAFEILELHHHAFYFTTRSKLSDFRTVSKESKIIYVRTDMGASENDISIHIFLQIVHDT